MYSFAGATTTFGGTTACYSSLRPYLDFWGVVLHIQGPPLFASQSDVCLCYVLRSFLGLVQIFAESRAHE